MILMYVGNAALICAIAAAQLFALAEHSSWPPMEMCEMVTRSVVTAVPGVPAAVAVAICTTSPTLMLTPLPRSMVTPRDSDVVVLVIPPALGVIADVELA